MQQEIRVVDLFSGCGGMSLGFEKAGFQIVGAFDNWQPAVSVYEKNFKHQIYKKNLFDEDAIDSIKSLNPEIIIGGPPCQDFSIAGKRQAGDRANLTRQFAKILASVKPKIFVMENVYNIEKMPILYEAIDILKRTGYHIQKKVLDASLCGVPQKRQRFIMIGYFEEPKASILDDFSNHYSKKPMTVRDYFGNSLQTEFYYMHPRSYNRRAVFSIDEPASTIRGVNRPIPKNYRFHSADKTNERAKIRSLNTKERSLIQTFPQDFLFVGAKTDIEQMIGNAVPVNLAYFVGSSIMRCFYD
jgi:DNA (cytosine-5)-methyltransferase 1